MKSKLQIINVILKSKPNLKRLKWDYQNTWWYKKCYIMFMMVNTQKKKKLKEIQESYTQDETLSSTLNPNYVIYDIPQLWTWTQNLSIMFQVWNCFGCQYIRTLSKSFTRLASKEELFSYSRQSSWISSAAHNKVFNHGQSDAKNEDWHSLKVS